MDIDKLTNALNNDNNDKIMNLTTKKIMELNLNILKELHLDRNTTLDYLKKLKGYRYIDEINDLRYGGYIRWIPISDPSYLPLNKCGIICDIQITDVGVNIICKNFMHRHFKFKMDESLIFQKLSSQELIILSALDHLDTPNNEDDDEEDDEEEEDDEADLIFV
jgi:hypothetical protein